MEKKYDTTIGLEIHAELKTATKMFCSSKNDPDEERPNVNICPVCMGHPGTLPVINKEAVKHVLKVGHAVGGKIADFTEFDRKNYFYPDIPKSYQISQYKYPLVSGGRLNGVELTRVHLEEDTATSKHEAGKENEGHSLVDFNRAGVPLMELVTEPVIKSAEEASAFARELQLLLRYLGASDANMEKGEMRVEANISVAPTEIFADGRELDTKGHRNDKLGTKVEVKNLNSFKAVEKAIKFEVDRQIAILEAGEKIAQETRGWDENIGKTFSQRSKEDSHDYRYFPDPDLPKLYISKVPDFGEENLKKEIPELPSEKRSRYETDFGIKQTDIDIFVQNPRTAMFFENAFNIVVGGKADDAKLLSNYILSDLSGLMKTSNTNDFGKATPEGLAEIVQMIKDGKLSSRGAKDILAIIFKDGGKPEKIAQERGLVQKNDPEAFHNAVMKVIGENPHIVEQFKAGKESAVNALIGFAMKEMKGSGNPQVLKELLIKNLI